MGRFSFNVHYTVSEHGLDAGDGMASGEVEAPDAESARAAAEAAVARSPRHGVERDPYRTSVSPSEI